MRPSTPEFIASSVRNDLLDGAIDPGARITEESLAARFGSGRHSVRSALQLLVAEGLLEHRRNRGIVVPRISAERIDSMCSYRAVLEMGALDLALARGDDLRQVETAVVRLESLGPGVPWRDVIDAHGHVHQRIVEAGGNERLTAAHAACVTELNCMLATIRTDYTAARLAQMHRDLLVELRHGGDRARRALHDDLELGGRAAMHRALARQSERHA